MRILVACSYSAIERDAFRALGHDAWSADFEECEGDPQFHYRGDVFDIIDDGWDMMIGHPPCTYLTVSGLHWNSRGVMVDGVPRAQKTEEGLEFVRRLMDAPIGRICIENPISCISSRIRKPDQIVQPYEFWEDASKRTCYWLKNLPVLTKDPAKRFAGRMVEWPKGSGKFVERWSNQTDSGQNRLGPSPLRWKERSRCFQGIVDAMAAEWGSLAPIVQ